MYAATAFALLAAASGAVAQTASVVNNCNFPIYVQPNGGQTVQLTPNGGTYREGFRPAAAIYIGNTPQSLGAPLTMEYNAWTDGNGNPTMSYDLSNNAGNPVGDQHNTLVTSNAACAAVNCAANDAACYSNGASPKVLSCAPSDLTATICAF